MRAVFVDANVIIDWLNEDSEQNELCTQCLEIICSLYQKPLVSPLSIAIVFYLVGKKVKDKKLVKSILKKAFSKFYVTSEDQKTVENAFNSNLLDIEDAIQYYSAYAAGADAILTFNGHDFPKAKIPILHPEEFFQLHNFK